MAPTRRDDETKSLMKFLWAGILITVAFTVWLSIGQDRAQEVTSSRLASRSSEQICPHCEGQKKTTCLRCGGVGKCSFPPFGGIDTCDVCRGSGVADCDVCGGKGVLTPAKPATLRWDRFVRP
jgi:hypothetical protein